MSSMLVWVLGAGGLLGSHLKGALAQDAQNFQVWDTGPTGIPWREPVTAVQELTARVACFAREARHGDRTWMVLWCAGAGVIGSHFEDLAGESAYFIRLLEQLGRELPDLPGKVLLASSAGGVYGNCPDHPLTETSACSPISDYGLNKLRQERLLFEWAQAHPNVSTLTARISNLYGPGQNLGKAQGLIAHISRSLLHRAPVRIYVPLDTLRDYLFVDDCARHLLVCLKRLGTPVRENLLKIFHSGETTTIAGLIAAFARIAKGHPRIICSADTARLQQPLRLQFKSTVWPELPAPARTDLAVGIQRVHSHHLALFQQGLLPPLAL